MATVVAVNIGSTFTDLVPIDTDSQEITTVEEPSVPAEVEKG